MAVKADVGRMECIPCSNRKAKDSKEFVIRGFACAYCGDSRVYCTNDTPSLCDSCAVLHSECRHCRVSLLN